MVLGIHLVPIVPVNAVQNNTSTTSESSIPNRTQDPRTQLDENENTESSTSTSNEDSTSDTHTTNSTEQSNSSTLDRIRPQADTYLREGTFGVDDPDDYDIDKDFSRWIRTGTGGQTITTTTIDGSTWTGRGKAAGELTVEDMEHLKEIQVTGSMYTSRLKSIKGIEFATKLKDLNCKNNFLTNLDVNGLSNLEVLDCSSNDDLTVIHNLGHLVNLTELIISHTKISSLTVASLTALKKFDSEYCYFLESIQGIENLTSLEILNCKSNSMLSSVNLENLENLKEIYFDWCAFTQLDVSGCVSLEILDCNNNQLSNLKFSQNGLLKELRCANNNLKKINFEECTAIKNLQCNSNRLTELDVSFLSSLDNLDCRNNLIKKLDITNNLSRLSASENQISDISFVEGWGSNTWEFEQEDIYIPIPELNSEGKIIIDKLKIIPEIDLNVIGNNISPAPDITVVEDKIILENVLPSSLNNKYITFSSYAAGTTNYKPFWGNIHFYDELRSEIKPSLKKVKTGETVSWVWDTKNPTTTTAENLKLSLNLPSNIQIDENTIEINGSPATLSDIDGSREYNLAPNDELSITFDTVASGNADDWLTPIGELNWEYSNVESPLSKQVKNSVQIKDDEQKYIPTNDDRIEISSVPVAFNFGTKSVDRVDRSYHLNAEQYQTNTNVVSDGFYVRVQDDRETNTGWSLAAKLSDFTYGSNNNLMPNSATTSIKLEDLSVESIINPDTPEEAINPSHTNPPTSVQQAEFIAGDDSTQTLISATANQGVDTWQLRIPFDKVCLNVPANGGRAGEQCNGKLTWLLTDTP